MVMAPGSAFLHLDPSKPMSLSNRREMRTGSYLRPGLAFVVTDMLTDMSSFECGRSAPLPDDNARTIFITPHGANVIVIHGYAVLPHGQSIEQAGVHPLPDVFMVGITPKVLELVRIVFEIEQLRWEMPKMNVFPAFRSQHIAAGIG